ncbi:putative estradiol 17-beta-dehydrogenase 12 [Diaporthe ampelina]|uniref:Putative estradiol 17-beta-dehydrogenase 12 n=1 Tax=Diaporthe ampelina TaxID=1214573 RepID=A0A0G2F9C3_9PEZI|nr:putative estradiol 17-beta-dehydrogenase 12 [Diaporthe ampelina]
MGVSISLVHILACIGTIVCLFVAERTVDFLLFHFSTPAKPLESYRRRGPNPAYALITGASAGIGYGIGQALVRNGFGVVLLGHKADELAEAAARLVAQVPPEYHGAEVGAGAFVRTIVMDAQTATPREMEDTLRAAIIDEGLRVSILVNNVGSCPVALPTWRELATYSPGDIDAVVDLNTRFMARLTALMVPVLAHNGSGSDERGMSFGTHRRSLIVNLSSAGNVGLPWMVMYGATKAFNLAFSRGLARELEMSPKTQHIDCLCIVPGDVRSQGNCLGSSKGSPDSDTYGGYIVNRVDGAVRRGWRDVSPYWLHHLQLALVDLIPESHRTKGVVDLMRRKKTAWDELDKSKDE